MYTQQNELLNKLQIREHVVMPPRTERVCKHLLVRSRQAIPSRDGDRETNHRLEHVLRSSQQHATRNDEHDDEEKQTHCIGQKVRRSHPVQIDDERELEQQRLDHERQQVREQRTE